MLGAVARRALRAMTTLVCSFVCCFLLLHGMPGDPADRLDAPHVPGEQAERNRRALGLDRPLGAQLLRTAASYARGDLGVSFIRKRAVTTVLAEALPATAMLGVSALFLAYGVGIPLSLALVALPRAWRRTADGGLLAFAVVPRFWLGVMLILLLHDLGGWFPASHAAQPGGGDWADRLRHLVLPTLALGLPAMCAVCRYQLAVMERVRDDPHVRSARARGAGGLRLWVLQVLRPSLGPALALFAVDLPVIVSGAIVVEVVFAWPGLGRVTAAAVLGSDYPLALAAALVSVTVVLAGRLLADGCALALLPRGRTVPGQGRP